MRSRKDSDDLMKEIKQLGTIIRKHYVKVRGRRLYTTPIYPVQYEIRHYNSDNYITSYGPKCKRKYTSTIFQRLHARAILWKIRIFSRDRLSRILATRCLKKANAERRIDIAIKAALFGVAAFFIFIIYSIYNSHVLSRELEEHYQREIQRQKQLGEYNREHYLRILERRYLEK